MTLGQADFAGTWQITRRIVDRHGAQSGRFDGLADLTPQAAAGLQYREDGTLTLDAGGTFRASRAYVWQFTSDRVLVKFDDGRDFHSFVPTGQAAGTDHPCGQDYYRVTYDFRDWPVWRAVWTVTGPAKDYTMTSLYTRR